MKRLVLFSIIILAVVLIGASEVQAAGTVTWNGGTSTAWATAANWTVTSGTPSTPPGSGDAVIIGNFAPGN